MGERKLASLSLNGVTVADYLDGAGLDPTLSPRPYLHPVRTLAGTLVTDAQPDDHPWHLGISVAIQDADGWNFWGGPTYVRGQGYTWRADHGRVEHVDFVLLDDSAFTERLHWVTPRDECLLSEHRRVRARLVERGWELEIVTTLTNAAERPVRIGSPATNGRAGAGYGGLFWRLPPARDPRVLTAAALGEQGVHDSVSPWLAWADGDNAFTVVLTGSDSATRRDSWFVRVDDYPGVGSQVAGREPPIVPTGGTLTRGLRTLLVDGRLDDTDAQTWADAALLRD